MKSSWQGFAAIIIFGLLIVFFLAAVVTNSTTDVSITTTSSGAVVVAPTNTPAGAAAIGQTGVITYTVQPGDWLSDIARRYSTTVPAILAANPQITNSDTIQPGVTLVLP